MSVSPFQLTCSRAGCEGASGELPARNSGRRAAEVSTGPGLRRAGLPGPRLLRCDRNMRADWLIFLGHFWIEQSNLKFKTPG